MSENKSDKKLNILLFIKGIIIGGTMLVPGVSGGSMAMILGIYDKLVSAVSSFRKNKINNFKVLLLAGAGGALGMFIFAGSLLELIEKHPMPTLYFFIGAVIGGVPMIFAKAKVKNIAVKDIVWIVMGGIIVIAISLIPIDGANTTHGGIEGILFLIIAGFIAAIALVLPGVSISYLLLVVGLYDETMKAISDLYMPYLIPLGIGMLLGVVLTTKIIEKAMERFPKATYLMILGFVLGSLVEVFPGVPLGMEILMCLLTFATGFISIYMLSKKETDK